MKYVEKVRGLGGKSWRLRPLLNAPVLYQLEFEGGGLAVGGVSANGFEETGALFKEWRTHCSADARSGAMAQTSILPVADAVEVTRNLVISNGFAALTVDFQGKLVELELEPVTLEGDWREVEVFDGGAWSRYLLETGNALELPMPFVAAVFRNGSAAVELGCGDDLWRYRVPEQLGSSPCKMVVECGANATVVRRNIIDFSKLEADAVPRRPWRFSWHLAWSTPAAPADISTWRRLDFSAMRLAPAVDARGENTAFGCPVAASSRKALRRAVRTAAGNTVFAGAEVVECFAASHLERPQRKELRHSCLTELFNFKLWAERRGAEQGMEFALRFADPELVSRLPSVAAIVSPTPEEVEVLPFVTP